MAGSGLVHCTLVAVPCTQADMRSMPVNCSRVIEDGEQRAWRRRRRFGRLVYPDGGVAALADEQPGRRAPRGEHRDAKQAQHVPHAPTFRPPPARRALPPARRAPGRVSAPRPGRSRSGAARPRSKPRSERRQPPARDHVGPGVGTGTGAAWNAPMPGWPVPEPGDRWSGGARRVECAAGGRDELTAVRYRSPGSLASTRANTSSRAGGSSGRSSDGGAANSWTCAHMIASFELFSNGARPVRHS